MPFRKQPPRDRGPQKDHSSSPRFGLYEIDRNRSQIKGYGNEPGGFLNQRCFRVSSGAVFRAAEIPERVMIKKGELRISRRVSQLPPRLGYRIVTLMELSGGEDSDGGSKRRGDGSDLFRREPKLATILQ